MSLYQRRKQPHNEAVDSSPDRLDDGNDRIRLKSSKELVKSLCDMSIRNSVSSSPSPIVTKKALDGPIKAGDDNTNEVPTVPLTNWFTHGTNADVHERVKDFPATDALEKRLLQEVAMKQQQLGSKFLPVTRDDSKAKTFTKKDGKRGGSKTGGGSFPLIEWLDYTDATLSRSLEDEKLTSMRLSPKPERHRHGGLVRSISFDKLDSL